MADKTILEKINEQRLVDIEEAKARVSLSELEKRLPSAPALIDFEARLRRAAGPVAVMAEIKRASPSKGDIALNINVCQQGLAYSRAGAAGISVLTEPTWFKGTLDDMLAVRQEVNSIADRPAILRKDFILDEYQVVEARVYGADTLLLIVKSLSDKRLSELLSFARSLGMEPLVEVQNLEEMERAVRLGSKVIGVNNRNLHTFDVDLNTTNRVMTLANDDVIVAALSGIVERRDVVQFQSAGAKAILVGETLMRAADPGLKLRELLGLVPPMVKICGIKDENMATETIAAGADMIGLMFVKSSTRYIDSKMAASIAAAVRSKGNGAMQLQDEVTKLRLTEDPTMFYLASAQQIREMRTALGRPLVVGVFVDTPADEINALVDEVGLDLVQLCGHEGWAAATAIKCPVIRTVHILEGDDPSAQVHGEVTKAKGTAASVLLDTKVPGSIGGGTGVAFDWKVAARLKGVPVIVAGGLTPENVGQAIVESLAWGVDVSSGVESNKEKDIVKIRAFVNAAKNAYNKE